jgi:threonine aldolase
LVFLNKNYFHLKKILGVDLLSLGFTKNGAMCAEALVHWNRNWIERTQYLRKQNGQLSSKMRFQSVQFSAMLRDELYSRLGSHANSLAQRLARGLQGVEGVRISRTPAANAVFACLDREVIVQLQKKYYFYLWNECTSEVRWMTHFDHTERDVDEFVADVKAEVMKTRK